MQEEAHASWILLIFGVEAPLQTMRSHSYDLYSYVYGAE